MTPKPPTKIKMSIKPGSKEAKKLYGDWGKFEKKMTKPPTKTDWEERYRALFNDFPTSAQWYAMVKDFISKELARARKEVEDEWRGERTRWAFKTAALEKKAHAQGIKEGKEEATIDQTRELERVFKEGKREGVTAAFKGFMNNLELCAVASEGNTLYLKVDKKRFEEDRDKFKHLI